MTEFNLSSFCRQMFPGSRILMTCATLLLFVHAADVSAHGVTLKYQDGEPADSAFTRNFLQPWAHRIHEDSRGRINLLIAPADPANANTDLFQAVMDRGADIVWLNLPAPAATFPEFMVFATALEGATSAGSSQALWTWADTNELAFREFKEMRILAVARHDAPWFHMRDNALSSLSDLKGANIAIPTADAATFLRQLGASPVVMTGPAISEALAKNSVDGVLLSWSSLAALKLEKLVRAHSEAPAGAPWPYAELSVLLMNPEAYRGLADDLKQTIRANSGNDVSALIGKTVDEAALAARTRATERGDTIIMLPESDLGKWRDATTAAVNERVAALDALGLKGEKMMSRARALIVQYDPARQE